MKFQIEREAAGLEPGELLDVFKNTGDPDQLKVLKAAIGMAEQLRGANPGLRVQMNLGGGSFKAQFRQADKSGAELAVILGDSEVERGVASVKPLLQEGRQTEVPLAALPERIKEEWFKAR